MSVHVPIFPHPVVMEDKSHRNRKEFLFWHCSKFLAIFSGIHPSTSKNKNITPKSAKSTTQLSPLLPSGVSVGQLDAVAVC